MGIRKSGWIIGGFLLILVIGIVYTNYWVHHNLPAKAATNETIIQPTYQYSQSKEGTRLTEAVNDTKFENDKIKMEQNKAISANQQNLEKETTTVQNTASTQKPAQTNTNPANTATPAEQPVQPANSVKKTVYLTFDDGPEIFSKDIVALLEKYHFKATFFMLDPNIKKHPDAVKVMVQAGESIGLHGVTHNKTLFYASEGSVLGEMDQTRTTLKSITGLDTFLIRTPYGSAPYMTPEYKKVVSDHGYLLWDWNIDSRDWFYKDERYVNSVINQIAKRGDRSGPIVILLHEKRETLAYLPKLFDYLSSQNFECKAINSSMPPIHF